MVKVTQLVQLQSWDWSTGRLVPRVFLETTVLCCLNSRSSVVTADPYQCSPWLLAITEGEKATVAHVTKPVIQSLLSCLAQDLGRGRVWAPTIASSL